MLEHIDVASRIAFARDRATRLSEDMSGTRRGRDVVTDDRPPRLCERVGDADAAPR